MCLETKWTESKVAEQDIISYKVVKKYLAWEKVVSYFQEFTYEIEKEYETHIIEEQQHGKIYDGFHSFKYVNDAFDFVKTKILKPTHVSCIHIPRPPFRIIFDTYVVLECTIPKGSSFYEGVDILSETDGYCSSRIKINGILCEYNHHIYKDLVVNCSHPELDD